MWFVFQVKRRLDWESGPATGTANIVPVSSNGTRVISIRSVPAAPFGQKLPSGQTTTVISIPPSLRSSDQLPLASSGTATVTGSNNSNKWLRCSSSGNDRQTRTQVIHSSSSTVSITPVNVRDDHLFKTPIKPAPTSAAAATITVLTPSARKRKVSGSSSTSSASPRSSPASHSDSGRTSSTLSGRTARQSASSSSIYSVFTDSPSGKSKHRYETSLGQLTKKFITLLRDAPTGVRDIQSPALRLVTFIVSPFCLLLRCTRC